MLVWSVSSFPDLLLPTSYCSQETISSLYKYFLSTVLHLSHTAVHFVSRTQLPINACLSQ